MLQDLRRIVLATMLVTIPVSLASAQEQPPPGSRSNARQPTGESPSSVFNLAFGGGSVEQYVHTLRLALTKNDIAANIIVKPDAAEITVPALELRDVTVDGALYILDGHQMLSAHGPARLVLEKFGAGGAPIYVIDVRHAGTPAPRESMVHVWNVNHLLGAEIKAEDLLTAIEAALALMPDEGVAPPAIKFHQATGLVMLRGNGAQVGTVDQVVVQLGDSAARIDRMRKIEMELAAAHAAQNETLQLKSELQSRQLERELMSRERDDLLSRIDRMRDEREMVANGSRALQENVAALEAALQQARERNTQLEHELSELRKKVESSGRKPS